MDVTTMALTPSLLNQLKTHFPDVTFVEHDDFQWSPTLQTVLYDPTHNAADSLMLHEVAHSTLGHSDYSQDIALLSMETDAWEAARTLAQQFDVTIDDDDVQDHLDTYRDWLHARSSCPRCEATGYQKASRMYECVACGHSWRVNDARTCALRRYETSKQ